MKYNNCRVRTIMFSRTFAVLLAVILISRDTLVFANISMFGERPSMNIPEGRPMDLQGFAKPNQMMNILPNRPVAARSKEGDRLYFTPNGKMSLRISANGTMSFSLSGVSKSKDALGNLTKETKVIKGTNRNVTTNEKGEVLGYQELGLGGKVLREFDNENNLTKTFQYDSYGKSTYWIIDELSLTMTVFNDKNQPACDVDFEGYKVAKYETDDSNRLTSKRDVYGNTTYFDKHGNMTYTEDFWGNKIAVYNYKQDEEGRYVLDTVLDPRTNNVTYFENGKQQVTKNAAGAIVKEYHWDGSKLIFVFDTETKETTWYNILGRPTYTSYNDIMIRAWLYYEGRQVGYWNASDASTIIYRNQRDEITVMTGSDEPPAAEQIKKWVDEGLIQSVQKGSGL